MSLRQTGEHSAAAFCRLPSAFCRLLFLPSACPSSCHSLPVRHAETHWKTISNKCTNFIHFRRWLGQVDWRSNRNFGSRGGGGRTKQLEGYKRHLSVVFHRLFQWKGLWLTEGSSGHWTQPYRAADGDLHGRCRGLYSSLPLCVWSKVKLSTSLRSVAESGRPRSPPSRKGSARTQVPRASIVLAVLL